MKYEILTYLRDNEAEYAVIQQDVDMYTVHSQHPLLEAAELVKEALEARQRAKNDRT